MTNHSAGHIALLEAKFKAGNLKEKHGSRRRRGSVQSQSDRMEPREKQCDDLEIPTNVSTFPET